MNLQVVDFFLFVCFFAVIVLKYLKGLDNQNIVLYVLLQYYISFLQVVEW